jgi:hypothetical protein
MYLSEYGLHSAVESTIIICKREDEITIGSSIRAERSILATFEPLLKILESL